MRRAQEIALTPNEELTLRRVAHGQSDAGRLRGQDLARLQALYLMDTAAVPRLTVEGRRRFERLAKPSSLASFDVESELSALIQRLAGAGVERGISSSPTKDGAMRTAFECFQKAAKCEEMASNTKDQANKIVLLATASHWRSLGNKAKAEETADLQDERQPPPKTS